MSFVNNHANKSIIPEYYHDIKIVKDKDVDDRVNFIIRCEGQEPLEKIKKFFKTKGRNITSDKAMEAICI